MQDKTDEAVKLLSPYSEFDKISSKSTYQYKTSYLLCFLELAHAKIENCGRKFPEVQGNPCYGAGALLASADDRGGSVKRETIVSLGETMKMLDYAERNSEGYDKAYALFKYGDVLFDLCEFRKAETYFKSAKAVLEDLIKTEKTSESSGSSSDKNVNPDISLLKQRIEAMLFAVFIELLEEDYSEAYALYVAARSFYDEGSFEAAMFICREVFVKYPETVYEQGLRLTYADCLLATGDVKEAKKTVFEMIEKYPKSPYLGEAMMKLGKIFLEHDWDNKQSANYYNQALAWFRAERERKDTLDLYTVPDKVVEVSAPPAPFSSLDEWKRTIYRKAKPTEIVNSRLKNALWYISEIEKECIFMVGFLLFLDGKFNEAKECFLQVKFLDANIAKLFEMNWPNVVMRLTIACEQGWMHTRPEHLKKFNDKNKARLSYACFLWVLEKFQEAEKIVDEVLQDPKSNQEEIAYALLNKIRCWSELQKGTKDERIKMFVDVYRKYPKTLSAPLGLYYAGCLEASRWGRTKEALDYYLQAYEKYPDTVAGEASLAACIDLCDEIDNAQAYKYAQKYLKIFPKGRYADEVKNLISQKRYDKLRGEKNEKMF